MQISIIIYYLSINWPTHISNNNNDDDDDSNSNSNSHNDNDDDNNSSNNNNNARIHTQWTYLPVAVYIIRGW